MQEQEEELVNRLLSIQTGGSQGQEKQRLVEGSGAALQHACHLPDWTVRPPSRRPLPATHPEHCRWFSDALAFLRRTSAQDGGSGHWWCRHGDVAAGLAGGGGQGGGGGHTSAADAQTEAQAAAASPDLCVSQLARFQALRTMPAPPFCRSASVPRAAAGAGHLAGDGRAALGLHRLRECLPPGQGGCCATLRHAGLCCAMLRRDAPCSVGLCCAAGGVF